jgi:hypothetical protein
LPWLEAFAPKTKGAARAASRRALVCLCAPLGFHAPYFFPVEAGQEYRPSPYLEVLAGLREQFTVISGLAHPEVGASHDSIFSFLTGAPHPELRGGFRNSISVDQFAARRLGEQTRFPSLALSDQGFSLSWTESGAIVPSETSPARLFARLFLDGTPAEVEAQARRLRDGQSILDAVADQSRSMRAKLSSADHQKLEEFFGSVRALERRLAIDELWSRKPKPQVNAQPPQDIANPADIVGRTRLMLELVHLALATDSTRIITHLMAETSLVPSIPGVSLGHHDLSHHGQDPGKIAQLRTVELELMKQVGQFLTSLRAAEEGGQSLLDRTMVFLGSNLGNASSHSTRNLPVLVAGGGFKHGRHLAFDPKDAPPLCNLFVTLLQRLEVETDRFGSSTGTLVGLEAA